MTSGNGHAHDAYGVLLLELERLHKRVREMEARVHAIALNKPCTRCERVLAGASRGGHARAEALRNDGGHKLARLEVARLEREFPHLSLSRRCGLVAKAFGKSGSTIYRWVK